MCLSYLLYILLILSYLKHFDTDNNILTLDTFNPKIFYYLLLFIYLEKVMILLVIIRKYVSSAIKQIIGIIAVSIEA